MQPQIELENVEMADETADVKKEEQKQIQVDPVNTSAKRDFTSLEKFEADPPKNETRVAVVEPPKKAEQLQPPTLQNVVATADLHHRLDLRKIAQWCRNAEYNPSRFSGLIMRIRDPRTTGLIFSTGKIVITGAKSEQAAM